MGEAVVNSFEGSLSPEVFADGDKLHFWCNDALLSIPTLGDGVRASRATSFASQSIVDLGVASIVDPLLADRGEPLADITMEFGVAPCPRAIIKADGRITLYCFIRENGVVLRNLAEWHLDVGINFT